MFDFLKNEELEMVLIFEKTMAVNIILWSLHVSEKYFNGLKRFSSLAKPSSFSLSMQNWHINKTK